MVYVTASDVSSKVAARTPNGAGSLVLNASIALAATSWGILFALGGYAELVGGNPRMLVVNVVLLLSPFLIGWWYLNHR